jgi:predicted lipid carrier protein YhbT
MIRRTIVASVEEVEEILARLVARFSEIDPSYRAMLPSRRTIEARCPDLDLVHWAEWRNGELHVLDEAPNGRADIRISVRSDDLLAMANGDLAFGRAYASNKVRLDASVTDLLRLRAVL